MTRALDRCTDLNLNIHSGEIVGVVGVEGNGQAELLDAIAGLLPVAEGEMTLDGKNLLPMSVLERREAGLAHIPQDRLASGLAAGASLAENMVATKLADPRFVRRGLLNLKAIEAYARSLIERFSIRAAGPHAAAARFRVATCKKLWWRANWRNCRVCFWCRSPRAGLILGPRNSSGGRSPMRAMQALRFCSVRPICRNCWRLSDRLVVFYRGRIVAAFLNADDLSQETLGTYMLGLKSQTAQDMQAGSAMSVPSRSRLAAIYAETARVLFALLIALGLAFVVIILISDDPGGCLQSAVDGPSFQHAHHRTLD